MNSYKKQAIIAISMSTMLLTISGCGEFSYKRGASATDFQQEKKSCSTEYKSESDVDKCLAKSGWIVVSADKPISALMEPLATTQPTNSDESKNSGVPLDPLEKIAIGSWWKAGSGPNTLMMDSKQCVANLGDAHQTENNMSLVTRGLLACMQANGWYALKQ